MVNDRITKSKCLDKFSSQFPDVQILPKASLIKKKQSLEVFIIWVQSLTVFLFSFRCHILFIQQFCAQDRGKEGRGRGQGCFIFMPESL